MMNFIIVYGYDDYVNEVEDVELWRQFDLKNLYSTEIAPNMSYFLKEYMFILKNINIQLQIFDGKVTFIRNFISYLLHFTLNFKEGTNGAY